MANLRIFIMNLTRFQIIVILALFFFFFFITSIDN